MDFLSYYKKEFSFLTNKDLEELLSITEHSQFKKGEKIIDFGDTEDKIVILLSGIVRGYIIDAQENELTAFIYQENDAFAAYEPIILSKPSNYAFECLEPTTALIIYSTEFERLFQINPRINKLKDKIILKVLLKTIKRNEDFIKLSPEKRYVNFIEKNRRLLQRVSQKHLASYLGITAVSFSRLKKRIYEQDTIHRVFM